MKFPYVQYEEMGVPVIPIEIRGDKWHEIWGFVDSYWRYQLQMWNRMKPHVYTDTSVIGGVYDLEFTEWSSKIITEFEKGNKIIVISDLTLRELDEAPNQVKNVLNKIPDRNKEFIELNDEAKKLAKKYITEGNISNKYLVDAQHIAIATVYKVDVVVSWNFKHIVNLDKIRMYNSINLKYGYHQIEIRSPREVLHEE